MTYKISGGTSVFATKLPRHGNGFALNLELIRKLYLIHVIKSCRPVDKLKLTFSVQPLSFLYAVFTKIENLGRKEHYKIKKKTN